MAAMIGAAGICLGFEKITIIFYFFHTLDTNPGNTYRGRVFHNCIYARQIYANFHMRDKWIFFRARCLHELWKMLLCVLPGNIKHYIFL